MGGTIVEKNEGTYRVLIYFCTLVPTVPSTLVDVLDRTAEHEEGASDRASDDLEGGKQRATA